MKPLLRGQFMEHESNPYESPKADQELEPILVSGEISEDSYKRRKRNCLIFLVAWTTIAGIVYGAAPLDWEVPLLFLDAVVFVIAIIQWTFIDAAQRKFRLWRYFVISMVFCPGPLIMMPAYFFSSRGAGDALKATGLAFAFLILLYAIDITSSLIGTVLFWTA